jgi:HEPN domain
VPEGERWAEAGRWFDRAEKDLKMAVSALSAETDLVENAAFHLQQAAELFPSLAPDLEGLDPFTSWVVAGPYDDGLKEGAPITRENAEWLMGRCGALLASARASRPEWTG